jgi:superfamily I DNA/RNA helicase
LLAYVRVLADPALATDDDLQTVFRIPNRYLPDASGARFAEALHSGNSFELAARSLGLEDWRSQHVVNGAAILDRARSSGDAPDALRLLRTVGGLDRHYADQELMSPHDQSDFEVLEAAERAANGLTLTNYAARLEGEARLLEESQSEDGVELATIHGSKGREWPVVILFGVDDGQLPHARSMTSDSRRSGSASNLEDERRLAYVALTRTQRLLIVMHLVESPSLFIGEAGLFSRDPVCGKPVTDPYGDRMTYVGGRAFYFCSNQCKLEFDRDPQRLSRSTLVGARLDQPKTAAAGG